MNLQSASVLVVDDTEMIRSLMESILAPAGYELRFAIDGSSALAEIERLTPDLVLLDHSMPDMTGVDVLRELSALRQMVP